MSNEQEPLGNERKSMADQRDRIADDRDRLADERERAVDEREAGASAEAAALISRSSGRDALTVSRLSHASDKLDANAIQRSDDRVRSERRAKSTHPEIAIDDDWAADRREFVADDRQQQADERQKRADERESILDDHERHRDELAAAVGHHELRGASGSRSDETAASVAASVRAAAAEARHEAGLARAVADRQRETDGGPHPLAAEFVMMGRHLLSADTIELAMADVVGAAVRFVNGCDAASFSALVGEIVTTIASTDPLALRLDQVQYAADEGPCLEAIRTMELVLCEDLARDGRWPAFAIAAADSARSVMSTPVGDERRLMGAFGSLNSYASTVRAFDDGDIDTAMLLTAHLGVLLYLARTADESSRTAVQLAEAVASRDVIGQAKGILMERGRLTAGEAFDVLRTASQRLNRKLRDIAAELVESGEITPPRD